MIETHSTTTADAAIARAHAERAAIFRSLFTFRFPTFSKLVNRAA